MTNENLIDLAVGRLQGKAPCEAGDIVAHPSYRKAMKVIEARGAMVLVERIDGGELELSRDELFDPNAARALAIKLMI